MYILTIVRCDVIFGEIEICMPIKAPTRSMCERIDTDTVTEDKLYFLKEYGDECRRTTTGITKSYHYALITKLN